MLVQPVAGELSDRFRLRGGRLGFIGLGVVLVLMSLFIFARLAPLAGILAGYLALQVTLSVTQAGQQGLIPDLAPPHSRGMASGIKGFMDMAGAMLGFVLLGQLLGRGQASLALAVIGAVLAVAYLLMLALAPEARSAAGTSETKAGRFSLVQAFRLDLSRHRAFARLVLARFLFLLATYAVGRFLLYFVAGRLGLGVDDAAGQAGGLLAGLALITVLASPLAGWAADRFGRLPLMIIGSGLSAAGVLLLIRASATEEMLLYGVLMSAGSAAFASANWAMTADLAPREEAARFFGLANIGTAGAAAAAGLFGPLVDGANRLSAGSGYPVLFVLAALIFAASILPLKGLAEVAGVPAGLPGVQQVSSLGGPEPYED
jgi:MFS family permease